MQALHACAVAFSVPYPTGTRFVYCLLPALLLQALAGGNRPRTGATPGHLAVVPALLTTSFCSISAARP